jgi:hypothetical protein
MGLGVFVVRVIGLIEPIAAAYGVRPCLSRNRANPENAEKLRFIVTV